MKSTNPWAALLSGLMLAGCAGDDGPRSNVSLATPPAVGAASSFLVSGDPAGSFGEAFIGTSGKGFILVGPTDAQPAQALYRVSGGVVQRAPAGLPGAVAFDANSTATIHTVPLTQAQLAGKYTVVIDGVQTDFQIGADGTISTADSACKLVGALAADEGVAGAFPLSVTLSGCAKSGSFNGYLMSATDYKPSSFRLVAENGTSVLDVFAYKYVTP